MPVQTHCITKKSCTSVCTWNLAAKRPLCESSMVQAAIDGYFWGINVCDVDRGEGEGGLLRVGLTVRQRAGSHF